jgi:hypothetical protein
MSELTQEQRFRFRLRMEQEAEASSAPATPEPSMGSVALNAVPKGVANLINTPVALLNLAKQGMDALPGIRSLPNKMPLTPNYPMQAAEKMGLVSPAREPQTPAQRVVDTAIGTGIAMAAAPAAGLANVAKNVATGVASGIAGQGTKEATGSDVLGLVAGMATPLAISGVSTVGPKLNAVKRTTLQEAQAAGFVVQPSTVKDSLKNNKLESVAGKAAVPQDASMRNQAIANKLAAEEIGLPGETALTEAVLNDVRNEAGAVYREIAELSPRASTALESLKQTRFEAKEQWNYYNRSGNPEAGKLARSLSARAEQYERVIEAEATRMIKVYGFRERPIETVQGTIERPLGLPAATTPERAGLPPGGPPVAQIETREVGFPLPDVAGNASKSRAVGFATPSTEQVAPVSREVGFAVPGAPRQALGSQPPPPRGWRETNATAGFDMELLGERMAGRPNLLADLRASRIRIAKTYDIEKALNLGTGDVSLATFGRLLDQGGVASKSGNLLLMGKFAQAFPRVARDASGVPPAAVAGTDAFSSAVLSTVGYGAAGGPAGLIVGGLPLLRGPARSLVLSKGYQSGLLKEPPALSSTLLKSGLAGKTLLDYRDAVER